MDFQFTPLARKLNTFRQEGVAVSKTISAEFITPTQTIPIGKVIQLHSFKDYERGSGDEIYIDIKHGMQAYQTQVLPYQQQLKIRVLITPFARDRSQTNKVDSSTTAVVYRAICLTTLDDQMGATDERTVSNPSMIDRESQPTMQFQLIDPVLENLLQQETGGNYYGESVKDVLTVEFTKILSDVESDTGLKMQGVDVIDPNNEDPVKMLVIPHRLPAMDLADHIQNEVGVYSTDIGCYYQSPHLYLYPLYDTTRFASTRKCMVIYNFPADKYPDFDRTWIDRGNTVEIASMRSSTAADASNVQTLVAGTGNRFTHASTMSVGMAVTKDQEPLMDRTANNNEFVTSERQDGVKVARGGTRVSDNRWRELSRTASRNGRTMMLTWEYANFDLVYPGMPVKVVWVAGNELREAEGVLLRMEGADTMAGSTMRDTQFNTHGSLTVYLAPKENDVIRPLS